LLKLQKLLKFTIKIENKQINFDVGVGRKTGKKKGRIITKDSNQKYNDFILGKRKIDLLPTFLSK
jgi:hypothetical protein